MTKFKNELSLEENLTFEMAQHWREPSYRPVVTGIDWLKLSNLLCQNRMAVLAMLVFDRAEIFANIPPEAQNKLKEQAEKYKHASSSLGGALVTYLHAASTRKVETVVLKGLWLCEKIYNNTAMRPGADIDILVRRSQVDECLALLKEQGIGEYWPNLLNDKYFTRHHLHQQRSTPDLRIWFEIHWALDHPYTLLTVNYEDIFRRAQTAQLLGASIREMALPDLLLSLSIHLVKHAIYLPSLIDREDLPRTILANGMLMYYLDVTEVIKQNSEMDWDLTIQLAREWGAVDILGSVLRACERCLNAPVPKEVLSALPVTGPWVIARKFMLRAAEQVKLTYEGRRESRFWKLLLMSNGAFILRPVRILETLSYFFPPTDYLERRYRRANVLIRIGHFLKAIIQSLRFAWDTFYFGLERYFRLKRMGKKTSLFNTLETDL